jgi:hypothetical protein
LIYQRSFAKKARTFMESGEKWKTFYGETASTNAMGSGAKLFVCKL